MAELVKLETQADMLFTPRAGYITKTLALNENGDVVELVKKSDGSIVSVGGGGGGGSSDGYVVVEDGGVLKAQKLAFDGTTASNDGEPVAIDTVGIFNTGMNEPEYKGSGGGSFYKCVSVDGTTWSGYKAIIDGDTGVWSFSEEVTSGLPYNKIVPQVGKVYDEECTFMVSGFDRGMLIPSYGLVFYAPLSTDYKDTMQGLEPTQTTGTFTEYNGKKMLQLDGTSSVLWSGGDFLPHNECSVFAIRLLSNWDKMLLYGFGNSSTNFSEKVHGGDLYVCTPSQHGYTSDDSIILNNLVSVCFTRNATGEVVVYYNGNFTSDASDGATLSKEQIFISLPLADSNMSGYISDFAIYNRALTADEVLSMHNNLMPQ